MSVRAATARSQPARATSSWSRAPPPTSAGTGTADAGPAGSEGGLDDPCHLTTDDAGHVEAHGWPRPPVRSEPERCQTAQAELLRRRDRLEGLAERRSRS